MTFRRILGLFNVKKELAELKDDIAAIQRDKEEWKQTAQLNERYAREAELKIRNLDREKQLLQEKVTALEAVKPAIKPTPASYAHVRQREEELHGLLSLMNTKLEDAKRQSAEHSKILDDVTIWFLAGWESAAKKKISLEELETFMKNAKVPPSFQKFIRDTVTQLALSEQGGGKAR